MSDLDGLLFKKVKVGGQFALRPSDVHSDEWLEGLKEGAEVIMTGRRPRNPKFHRLFFALLRKVRDNDPEHRWQTEEALLDDLKLVAGHYEIAVNVLSGQQELRPKSISFAAMAEDVFKRFFMRCVHILTTKVLVGTVPQELIDEVFLMAEGKPAPKDWRY